MKIQTCGETLGSDLSRNLLERMGHFLFVFIALPLGGERRTSLLASCTPLLLFRICAELGTSDDVPGSESKPLARKVGLK